MKATLLIGLILASVVIQPVQTHQEKPNPTEHQDNAPENPASSTSINKQKSVYNYCLPEQKTWDWYDAIAPPTWSSWALVGVGIGAIIAALCTLGTLKQQAIDTGIAAQAALLNAQAVINSERAWIEAELVPKTVLNVTQHDLMIRNYGKTPAQLSGYEIKYGPTNKDGTWSLETLEGKFSKPVRFFLGIGEPPIKLQEFPIAKMFTNLTNAPAEVITGYLCFTIHYADVVGADPKQREGHKTCFVYEYNILLGSLERKSILTQYT